MDTRLIGVEFHEPQLRLVGYEHVRSLHGICLRLIGRVAFALQRHWRHVVRRSQQWHSRLPPMRRIESDIRWQRPCMMAAFTASRHFTATLGAPRPRPVLGEMGTAVFSRHDMVFVKGDVSWTNVSHDKRQTTVRTSREQHVPDSIACTQNQPRRVGGGLWGNTCGTCRPQPPSHTLSKEKKRIR